MSIISINLKNFRCFQNVNFTLEFPLTIIYGLNGAGKSSFIEACYFLGNMKSFRTHTTKDCIAFNQDAFFIKAIFDTDEVITIGCSTNKKYIRVNDKAIKTLKELQNICFITSMTNDDIELVKEGPDARRSFLDHSLLCINDINMISLYKQLRIIINNRNALLAQNKIHSEDMFIWTEKLWNISYSIQKERIRFLNDISLHIQEIINQHFQLNYTLQFQYKSKIDLLNNFNDFLKNNTTLFTQESRLQRSLFGAHLDDFLIIFNDKPAKLFSSRGQQKLIVFLLKCGFISFIKSNNNLTKSIVFMLDDIMTDFDNNIKNKLFNVLKILNVQIIITSPNPNNHQLLNEIFFQNHSITL